MNNLIPVFEQIRFWCSQILALQFMSWVTMLPFVYFACNEIYKLLKRIR